MEQLWQPCYEKPITVRTRYNPSIMLRSKIGQQRRLQCSLRTKRRASCLEKGFPRYNIYCVDGWNGGRRKSCYNTPSTRIYCILTVFPVSTACRHYSRGTRQGLCNGTVSVRLSIQAINRCSSVQRVCCCGFGGQEISIDCCTAGAAAARRSAANASSVTFTAAVEGWTQTCPGAHHLRLCHCAVCVVAYSRRQRKTYDQFTPPTLQKYRVSSRRRCKLDNSVSLVFRMWQVLSYALAAILNLLTAISGHKGVTIARTWFCSDSVQNNEKSYGWILAKFCLQVYLYTA